MSLKLARAADRAIPGARRRNMKRPIHVCHTDEPEGGEARAGGGIVR